MKKTAISAITFVMVSTLGFGTAFAGYGGAGGGGGSAGAEDRGILHDLIAGLVGSPDSFWTLASSNTSWLLLAGSNNAPWTDLHVTNGDLIISLTK